MENKKGILADAFEFTNSSPVDYGNRMKFGVGFAEVSAV
jgi:hypothetical protein